MVLAFSCCHNLASGLADLELKQLLGYRLRLKFPPNKLLDSGGSEFIRGKICIYCLVITFMVMVNVNINECSNFYSIFLFVELVMSLFVGAGSCEIGPRT